MPPLQVGYLRPLRISQSCPAGPHSGADAIGSGRSIGSWSRARPELPAARRIFDLKPNQSTCIPLGTRHRLENPGQDTLRVIEIQCGDYLGEDDIERFDDISVLIHEEVDAAVDAVVGGHSHGLPFRLSGSPCHRLIASMIGVPSKGCGLHPGPRCDGRPPGLGWYDWPRAGGRWRAPMLIA